MSWITGPAVSQILTSKHRSMSKARGRADEHFIWNLVLSSLSGHMFIRKDCKGKLLTQPWETRGVIRAVSFEPKGDRVNAFLTPS